MRKALRIVSWALAVIVILASALMGAGYLWISNPKHERLPLPNDLVSLESAEGKTLLAESNAKTDHEPLMNHFQTQEKGSWCGVASAVTVINSFPTTTTLSQTAFFNECAANVRSSFRTKFGGMTLDDFARMVQCHKLKAQAFLAESSSIDEFRRSAAESLKLPGSFVVVNYDRAGVGQTPGGHISPVSAYHASSDRFLVLDVAGYKYPPVWVKTSALWAAMSKIDNQSKHSRGYVIVAAN